VNLTGRLAMPRSWSRLPRRTVRLRLTLLYSGLFLAAGAGLLAITYLLVRTAGNSALGLPTVPSPGPTGGKSAAAGAPPLGFKALELQAQARATRSAYLHELLIRSGIALAVMAALAVALGWLVAGRVLRPLRIMTSTTQRITEQNLHERLALPGPSDEIKDLADTIDGLLQRLEAAFDAQRHFVANASHELRTPLTVNRALLEFTLANPDATVEDLRTMGQELITSGEQQEQLIEALLTLATSARGLERHEPVDLSEITARVLARPHPEIDQLGLDVQTTIDHALTVGDPRLAERLVSNLIDNALRHNLVGGRVQVTTAVIDGKAKLTVTNTGSVVPPNEVNRLFQPFQRLHTDRMNHPDGHGLGLSIVRAIADAHDTTIAARPRPEGGLRVTVTFPPPMTRNETSLGPATR
jgi:signal transduction histidine kinase